MAIEPVRIDPPPDLDEIVSAKKIGQGKTAIVYEATLDGKTTVAVKRIPKDRTQPQKILRSECFPNRPDHPCLIQVHGICLTSESVSLVMARAQFDLYQFLNQTDWKRSSFDWTDRLCVALRISLGIYCLHNLNIIHRDLKSGNILLFSEYLAVVCDLESCVVFEEGKKLSETGSTRWKAPESLKYEHYNKKTDIYSFSMILYELLELHRPFSKIESNNIIYIRVVNEAQRPEITKKNEDGSPQGYIALMRECWDHDPDKRPNIGIVFVRLLQIYVNQILRILSFPNTVISIIEEFFFVQRFESLPFYSKTPMHLWKHSDVLDCLKALGLAEYEEAFDDLIDGQIFENLTEADLEDFNITKPGDRKKLLDFIKGFAPKEPQRGDLPVLVVYPSSSSNSHSSFLSTLTLSLGPGQSE